MCKNCDSQPKEGRSLFPWLSLMQKDLTWVVQMGLQMSHDFLQLPASLQGGCMEQPSTPMERNLLGFGTSRWENATPTGSHLGKSHPRYEWERIESVVWNGVFNCSKEIWRCVTMQHSPSVLLCPPRWAKFQQPQFGVVCFKSISFLLRWKLHFCCLATWTRIMKILFVQDKGRLVFKLSHLTGWLQWSYLHVCESSICSLCSKQGFTALVQANSRRKQELKVQVFRAVCPMEPTSLPSGCNPGVWKESAPKILEVSQKMDY